MCSVSRAPAAWCRINKECTPQVYIFIQVGSLWLAVHWLCSRACRPARIIGHRDTPRWCASPSTACLARSPAMQDVSMEGADGAENEAANEEGEGEPCHAGEPRSVLAFGVTLLATLLG